MIPPMNRPSQTIRSFANTTYRADRASRRCLRARRAQKSAPPVTNASCSAIGWKAKPSNVAADHAALARDLAAAGQRAPVILSGGELTVTDPRQRPRRPQPGIRAGAGDLPRQRTGHCRARRRYRRHRWRRRQRGRSRRGLCGRRYRRPGTGRRPRSSRFPAKQRFNGLFCRAVGLGHDRPHVHKCQRFPCDTCRQGMIPLAARGPRLSPFPCR